MASRFSIGFGLRVAVFLYVTIQCCPVEFFPIGANVDASWQLGVNLAAEQGLRFGDDVLWPSGPFAYLDTPMPVGDNLAKGLAAQLALWALVAAALAELIFFRQPQAPGLLALAACVGVGAPLFHFNGQGMDSLLAFAALLMAASALRSDSWKPRLTAAAVAAGLAGVFKLSAAVIGGTGVAAAALLIGRRNLRDAVRAFTIAAVAGPGATLAAYLAHNPSLGGFWRYFRSLSELASGYSAAMSLSGPDVQFRLALGIVLGVLLGLLAVSVCLRDADAAKVAALFALPLFFSFKHGFVRADAHIASFSCFAVLSLGIVLAHADWRRLNGPLTVGLTALTLPVALLMSAWSASEWARRPFQDPGAIFSRTLSGAAALQDVGKALDLGRTRSALLKHSTSMHEEAGRTVPASLRERLGDEPVAVLSPFSGAAFLQGLNLQVLPIIQKYSAYTPPLDTFLAEKLERSGHRYLLFEWQAIDGRHPLLETPQTWSRVWQWFDCVVVDGDWALLERRAVERFPSLTEDAASFEAAGPTIRVPEHQGPLFASIHFTAAPSAFLAEAFYRIPPMSLEIELANGNAKSYRTFPAAFEGSVPLSPTPLNMEGFAAMLAPTQDGEAISSQTASFRFGGPGAAYYSADGVVFLHPEAGQHASVETLLPDR